VVVSADGLLTLERDQAPTIENAFGSLQRLAKRKPASVIEMRAAVKRRARRKHSVKGA
jgi:hypothetical protein